MVDDREIACRLSLTCCAYNNILFFCGVQASEPLLGIRIRLPAVLDSESGEFSTRYLVIEGRRGRRVSSVNDVFVCRARSSGIVL